MEFHEYPKWVHPPGKPSVIVQDAEEEARVLASSEIPLKRGPGRPRKVTDGDLHDDA